MVVASKYNRPGLERRRTGGVRDYFFRKPPVHAFTLVEVLTVLSVIAILAVLVLPGISRAKQRARAVICQSNLHQIGLALQMYTADYSYFPPFADLRISPYVRTWPALLLWYAGDRNIFYCPGAPETNRWSMEESPYGFSFPFNVDVARPFSYGYNRDGVRWGAGLGMSSDEQHLARFSHVVSPSEFIALADSSNIASIHFEYIPRFRRVLGPPLGRHAGNVTVLFADGSTRSKSQTRLLNREDSIARLWNIDYNPHRELW